MNNNEMTDYLFEHLDKSDIYSAKAIAHISMFIYKRRKELKMSQKEFAKMMGVTQAMVSKWESAEYNFSIKAISEIAEKLDVIFNIEFSPEIEYLANTSSGDYEEAFQTDFYKETNTEKYFYIAA